MGKKENSEAFKELANLYRTNDRLIHPSMPAYARTVPRYSDKTANGLTKCVIDYIRLTGGLAERINSTGRYIDNSRVFEDVLGRKRSIGTGQWLPTSGMKGTADISAVIQGRAVKIEIKMKDRQSEDQKKYQKAVEQAGGIYLIFRSFQEFYDWYQSFTR
jgi:hypothetical protein